MAGRRRGLRDADRGAAPRGRRVRGRRGAARRRAVELQGPARVSHGD